MSGTAEVVIVIALVQSETTPLIVCDASSAGWQLRTPLGSPEAGDLPSARSIRTCGPKARNIQGSGAPVSIDSKLARMKSVKMTDFWLNWWSNP